MVKELGIRAKVEPEVDKSSQSRLMRDLEKDIEELEELTFENNGIEGRTTPGGGGVGSEATAMGAGRMSKGGGLKGKLGGAAGGAGMMAGAAVMGTVALGGVLANKMYGAMSKASGRLQSVNSILGQASKLFFKPFGDALGDALLPYAKKGLEMATNFNEIASDKGLKVAITSLAGDIESKLGLDDPSITIPSPEDIFGTENLEWDDFMDALEWADWLIVLPWDQYLVNLVWDTWINSLTWDNFMNTLRWVDFVHSIDWSTFIDYLDNWGPHIGTLVWNEYVSGIRWSDFMPSPSGSAIVDKLFGHLNISLEDIRAVYDVDPSVGTDTARRRSRDPTVPQPDTTPVTERGQHRSDGETEVEITAGPIELDGRRIAERKTVRKRID